MEASAQPKPTPNFIIPSTQLIRLYKIKSNQIIFTRVFVHPLHGWTNTNYSKELFHKFYLKELEISSNFFFR